MNPKPINLGKHIVIWGTTGSGKTTLARRLAEALGLGVIEMDAIRHARGWDSTPWDEFRQGMVDALGQCPEGWVCEGNYSRVADIALAQADSIIWLHLPWPISFWRLFKRTVSRALTREPLYHESGPTESWRLTFLSPRSILWWSISNHRTHLRTYRRRLLEVPNRVRTYELTSGREVQMFLASVKGELSTTREL